MESNIRSSQLLVSVSLLVVISGFFLIPRLIQEPEILGLLVPSVFYRQVAVVESSASSETTESDSASIASKIASDSNIYISQDGTGNGSSCSDSLAVSWFNTATNWGTEESKIGPGDIVHICGTISTSLFVRGSGVAGNPITIFFEPNAKLSAGLWTGSWSGVSGAIQVKNVDNIILDGGINGLIEATDSGTDLQHIGSQGILLYNVSNSEVKNFTVKNMYVRTATTGEDSGGTGIYVSAGSNNSIHDNRIFETQTAIIYIYPQNGISRNIKIYNNKINNTNWGIIVGESNINALADNIEIYNNDIGDQGIWDDPENNFHHDGIFVYAVASGDKVTNLRVYNNYIHGNMGLHVTAMIYSSGYVISPYYFNNVLVNTGPNGISNGFINAVGGSKIFNNTFIDHSSSMGAYTGSESDIKNNIFYNSWSPVAIRPPINSNTFSDQNILFNQDKFSLIAFLSNGNGTFYSLEKWREVFNLDLNSTTSDPLLINSNILNGDYHIRENSPALGTGINLSSHCSNVPQLCFDKDGNQRPSTGSWDVGAYQRSSVVIQDSNSGSSSNQPSQDSTDDPVVSSPKQETGNTSQDNSMVVDQVTSSNSVKVNSGGNGSVSNSSQSNSSNSSSRSGSLIRYSVPVVSNQNSSINKSVSTSNKVALNKYNNITLNNKKTVINFPIQRALLTVSSSTNLEIPSVPAITWQQFILQFIKDIPIHIAAGFNNFRQSVGF